MCKNMDIHKPRLSFLANVTAQEGGLQTEMNVTSQGGEKIT